jgi:hypothetical protein
LWQDEPKGSGKFFPGTERFVKENARFSTGPESMFWNKGIFPRQVLTLTAADWDGDGLEDLIVSRFKDEAPGVKALGVHEQWTPWGRKATRIPKEQGAERPDPALLSPLKQVANINDDLAGRVPDLGAHEHGRPLPVYGPRAR